MPCASCCQSIAMDGVVVIGEGEKDNAPMLFNGERIGDGSPPKTDIAVDPIDGTTPTALGPGRRPGRDRRLRAGDDVRPRPVRLHGEAGRRAPGGRVHRHRRRPPRTTSKRWPRPRASRSATSPWSSSIGPATSELIAEVRESGARIRLITDGDVAGAIATGVAGHGGRPSHRHRRAPPRGCIAAAALKCMGGEIQGRLWPRDDDERRPPSTPATTSTRC